MASSAAPAAAPHPAAGIDVESLLWEVRDLLRGIAQVNKSQAAELARLGSSLDLSISAEYDERQQLALKSIDVALEHLALAPSSSSDNLPDDASVSLFDDSHVRAWLLASSTAQSVPGSVVGAGAASTTASSVEAPSDFWTTQEFNWDEEPELDSPPSPSSLPELDNDVVDDWEDDGEVTPWDSVSVRALDELDEAHGSSGDDSDTLFQPDDTNDDPQRIRFFGEPQSKARLLQLAREPVKHAILRKPAVPLQPHLLHHSAIIAGF